MIHSTISSGLGDRRWVTAADTDDGLISIGLGFSPEAEPKRVVVHQYARERSMLMTTKEAREFAESILASIKSAEVSMREARQP